MKVLYVIDTLEGYGAEKSLVEIALNLKNIIPVFVHLYPGDFLRKELEERGIKVYSLNVQGKYAFSECLKRLIPVYEKERPDIVHATLFRAEIVSRKLKSQFPETCLVGSFVSKNYAGLQFHGFSFLQKLKLLYFHLLNRYTLNKVDYFISNSHVIKESTIKELNIPRNNVAVIHRGRDIRTYQNNSLDQPGTERAFLILNVSRLIPSKGQSDLLRAIALKKDKMKNFKLVIAGEGNYRSYLEEVASSLGLMDLVEFPGRVNDVATLLSKTHLFVYPSYTEGLPGALIEAMLAGKIIIASNIPENLECVDENSAILYKKGDIVELSEKIFEVYSNPKKFYEKSFNATRQARSKFDVSLIANEYEKVYSKFVNN